MKAVTLLLFALVLARLSTADDLQAAQAFARDLGLPGTLKHSTFPGSRTTNIYVGPGYEIAVVLGAATGYVNTIPEEYAATPGPNGPAIKSEAEAWSVAEEWLTAHHVAYGQRGTASVFGSNGSDTIDLNLSWPDVQYGYRVVEGNSLSVVVNLNAGKINSLSWVRDYSYKAPVIKLSESDAKKALAEKVRTVLGGDSTDADMQCSGLAFLDAHRGGFNGPAVLERAPQPISQLAYCFKGNYTVKGQLRSFAGTVDAETGEVLSGGQLQSVLRKPPQKTKAVSFTPPGVALSKDTLQKLRLLGIPPTRLQQTGVHVKEEQGQLRELVFDVNSPMAPQQDHVETLKMLGVSEGALKFGSISIGGFDNTTWLYQYQGIPVGKSYRTDIYDDLKTGRVRRIKLPNGRIIPGGNIIPESAALQHFRAAVAQTFGQSQDYATIGLFYGAAGAPLSAEIPVAEVAGDRVLVYGFRARIPSVHRNVYGIVRASDGKVLSGGFGRPDWPHEEKWRQIERTGGSWVPWGISGLAVGAGAALYGFRRRTRLQRRIIAP